MLVLNAARCVFQPERVYPRITKSDALVRAYRAAPAGPLFLWPRAGQARLKTKTPQERRVLDLADPIAEALGFEIVRIRLLSGRRQTLQVMAERVDGTMDVEACAALSRALSEAFDAADPVSGEYVLEVSSPGVDRPLTEPAHFERWEGFEAKIELDRLAEGRKRFKGVLAGVESGPEGPMIGIDLPGEEDTAMVPYAWVIDAKLVLTDALMAESLKGRPAGGAEQDAGGPGDTE